MERYGIGRTDVGFVRKNNEDSFFVQNNRLSRLPNLYIVADGMGGHQAGEVASAAAIEHFCAFLQTNADSDAPLEMLLSEATRYANNKVYQLSRENESTQGMGTTFSVCCCDSENLYFAHVGDSRIYMLSDGQLNQLTIDHTYVEEMMRQGLMSEEESHNDPHRHMLTRALGTEFDVQVDADCIPLRDEDTILLCSDGLTNMLNDAALAAVLLGADKLENKAEQLVAQALEHGGVDNVTVVLL